MRTAVLRRIARKDSYHHADRTIIAELTLHGPFYQVPDWLYFRRDHPERAERANPSMRSRCANMDPRRADKLRNPAVRLYGEYVWAYLRSIRQAPISAADKRECYRYSVGVGRQPGQVPAARPGAGGRRRARQHQRRRARGRPEGEHVLTRRSTSARGGRSPAAPRVGLFGLLGSGNIGNDASMESVLGYLRARHPGAVVDAMCMGPESAHRPVRAARHPAAVGQAVRGPSRRGVVRRGPGAGQGHRRGPDGPLGAPARRGDRPGHGRPGGEPPAARLGSAVRDVPAVRGRAADRHQGRAGQRGREQHQPARRPGSSSTPPPGWRTTGPTGTPSPGRRWRSGA